MQGRGTSREILVGVVVVVTLVGLLGLLGLAGGGPGFLTARRTIDVVFRDGQGIRVGCPVRVAGLDAGRVVDVDLTEIDETLWARVRISLPIGPREQAEAGRQDHDPGEPGRAEPGQHRLLGPVEGGAGVGPGGARRRVDVLRPGPRAGRARAGRAEPPEPHDRRGAADDRRRRAAGPPDAGHDAGDGGRPPRLGRHGPARPSRRRSGTSRS